MFLAIMTRHRVDDNEEESDEYIDENEEFYLNGGAENIQSIQVGSFSSDEMITFF